MKAEVVILKEQLEKIEGDLYAVRLKSDTGFPNPLHVNRDAPLYLSVQPDGSFELRNEVGAWETGQLRGSKLVFSSGNIARAVLVV